LRLTAWGLLLGLGLSLLLTRFLHILLFGVSTGDPMTFLTVAGRWLLIAAAACPMPALKAMRVDPMLAIRAH